VAPPNPHPDPLVEAVINDLCGTYLGEDRSRMVLPAERSVIAMRNYYARFGFDLDLDALTNLHQQQVFVETETRDAHAGEIRAYAQTLPAHGVDRAGRANHFSGCEQFHPVCALNAAADRLESPAPKTQDEGAA
jgi:hypothetical protein